MPLDGYDYDGCTFARCTFVYKGEKPFKLRNFKLEDDWNVAANSPQFHHFSALLTALRFLGKDIEVADEFKPDEPIAYGEVRPESEQIILVEDDSIEEKGEDYQNRVLLLNALENFQRDGRLLLSGNYDTPYIDDWERRATDLVKAAFGNEAALDFLSPEDPNRPKWDKNLAADATKDQIRLPRRLNKIDEYIRHVDTIRKVVALQPDFDGRKWWPPKGRSA